MSINTDKIKSGGWVQVANGDWCEVVEIRDNEDEIHSCVCNFPNGRCAIIDMDAITAHLTAEEVEANGLPVSDREIVDYVSCQTHLHWNGAIKSVSAALRPYSRIVYADGTDFRQAVTHAIQQQRKDEKND